MTIPIHTRNRWATSSLSRLVRYSPMPKKLAQPRIDLAKAIFVNRGGKGSHPNYEHPSGYRLLVSVHKGEAKPYQQRDIETAINSVNPPRKSQ